jgi:DNA processing protein
MTTDTGPMFAAALASLPGMTIQRLRTLMSLGDAEKAYAMAGGRTAAVGEIRALLRSQPDLAQAWKQHASTHPSDETWQRCRELGVAVLPELDAAYPAMLRGDRDAPAVMFVAGDVSALDGRRAAIVGTRNATSTGLAAAYRLGRELADCGVHVVSGLARGIDGRAHRGVRESAGRGRPIGVVASGHDVVYPREHGELWRYVAEHGVLLSESPPGTRPEPFRFPLRNRLVARLSEVVVVVESRDKGGSLITAADAAERGVPVMALPGSTSNRSAAGTNRLLRDGAGVVLDVDDVLAVLSISHVSGSASPGRHSPGSHSPGSHSPQLSQKRRGLPDGAHRRVYQACADEGRTLETVALACGMDLADAAEVLLDLEAAGWLRQLDGWYSATESALR